MSSWENLLLRLFQLLNPLVDLLKLLVQHLGLVLQHVHLLLLGHPIREAGLNPSPESRRCRPSYTVVWFFSEIRVGLTKRCSPPWATTRDRPYNPTLYEFAKGTTREISAVNTDRDMQRQHTDPAPYCRDTASHQRMAVHLYHTAFQRHTNMDTGIAYPDLSPYPGPYQSRLL